MSRVAAVERLYGKCIPVSDGGPWCASHEAMLGTSGHCSLFRTWLDVADQVVLGVLAELRAAVEGMQAQADRCASDPRYAIAESDYFMAQGIAFARVLDLIDEAQV